MGHKRDDWNRKYQERGSQQFQPEVYLVQNVHRLRPSSVVEVACGDGRNALYLCRQGFDVTGVDFSEEGIARLCRFAAAENLKLRTQVMDAEDTFALAALGVFDNAIFIHYKPSVETFRAVASLLRPQGILLMTSFNRQHLIESPHFSSDLCYENEEFLYADGSLEVLEYVSYTDDRGWLDGYIFRKLVP